MEAFPTIMAAFSQASGQMKDFGNNQTLFIFYLLAQQIVSQYCMGRLGNAVLHLLLSLRITPMVDTENIMCFKLTQPPSILCPSNVKRELQPTGPFWDIVIDIGPLIQSLCVVHDSGMYQFYNKCIALCLYCPGLRKKKGNGEGIWARLEDEIVSSGKRRNVRFPLPDIETSNVTSSLGPNRVQHLSADVVVVVCCSTF